MAGKDLFVIKFSLHLEDFVYIELGQNIYKLKRMKFFDSFICLQEHQCMNFSILF